MSALVLEREYLDGYSLPGSSGLCKIAFKRVIRHQSFLFTEHNDDDSDGSEGDEDKGDGGEDDGGEGEEGEEQATKGKEKAMRGRPARGGRGRAGGHYSGNREGL
jgi:hypothetical protein